MAAHSPLARRMPGFDARHATRRARRTRVVGVGLVAVAGVVALALYLTHESPDPSAVAPRTTTTRHAVPQVVTALATWRLRAPISRAVVLTGSSSGPGQLIIFGGATTGGATASGIFGLDVHSGALAQVGNLVTALDDASGAVVGGQELVLGGSSGSGSASASASVQGLMSRSAGSSANGAATGTSVPRSNVVGTLPEPRTAATAITSGTTTYLVGGSNPGGADPTVLRTTDGRHFGALARLRVPVNFPAVAVVGTKLYVFGGDGLRGVDAGRPVNTIQIVDLKTHKVTDLHHLPVPLAGAGAVVLNGQVLLAGGETTALDATARSTTTAPTGTGGAATAAVSTVWVFDPASGTATPVGNLPVAASHAGVAVLGSTAWLVGGESGGTPVSVVQTLALAPGGAHHPGTTSPKR